MTKEASKVEAAKKNSASQAIQLDDVLTTTGKKIIENENKWGKKMENKATEKEINKESKVERKSMSSS